AGARGARRRRLAARGESSLSPFPEPSQDPNECNDAPSSRPAAPPSPPAPRLLAQVWPNSPVRIVVGFPPGGGTDALARVVAAKLTQMWNQQVIVETKAGVAGVLAAEYTAQQPSDGATLLMAHINSHGLAPSLQPKLRYSVERDFVPIVLVGVTPNLLIANPAQ